MKFFIKNKGVILIKKILKKINDYIGELITAHIIESALHYKPSIWSRLKWKVEDCFNYLFRNKK